MNVKFNKWVNKLYDAEPPPSSSQEFEKAQLVKFLKFPTGRLLH